MTPSEISNLISRKIIHRRNELGMTRRAVIKAASLHDNALYTYENNPQCRITAVNLYRISKVFNVSMDYFFEDIEELKTIEELKVDYEKEEISYE
jgi:transcriptional regulator with XRE-family HTH domain